MQWLLSNWNALIQFGEWATQGGRMLITLTLIAMLCAEAGLWLRGGAPLRQYVLAVIASPFFVLIAFLLAWALQSLFAAYGGSDSWLRTGLLLAIFPGTAFAIGYAIAPGPRDDGHARGARVTSAPPVPSTPPRPTPNTAAILTLAGQPIERGDETKHFKLIGTTGTGKSTAIRELLRGALQRRDRAVIADPDGGYLARFYDPKRGDVILNPFDGRSRRWDLFQELRQAYDYDQLARSLIGAGEGADRSWRQYAQVYFASVLRQLHEAGVTDLGALYRVLTMAPLEELRVLLEGTPARPFLDEGNERMFASIRSVTAVAVAPLEYIHAQKGHPFSIRAWVENGRGVLFLPYQADQIVALRSVISTWMRIAIFQTMSQGEADHKLWFIVDELDALGAIDGLKDALARLRKFGGRCVLGFQSIAQVRGTYGDAEAQTIVENCGNTLILRCSASEGGGTALFASRLIGDREILREHVTHSRSGSLLEPARSTVSHGVQHVTERAVLPSEIEQLPDLEGLLKFASSPQWMRVRLR